MKRQYIRYLLRYSGITELKWLTLPQKLYCLNYHRIGNPADTQFDRGVFSCTQENFRRQVLFFQHRFHLLKLNELIHLKDSDLRLQGKKPLAILTFDDGYIDNYTLAFPVLRDLGAHAVFFLPTSYIGSKRIPWWDEISWLVRHASKNQIRIESLGIDLPVPTGNRDRVIRTILHAVKAKDRITMDQKLNDLRVACDSVSPCGDSFESLFMSWDNAREMLANGMEFGSHTHNHHILSHLEPADQLLELIESKYILERELQTLIRTTSYPVGNRSSYTPETRAAAAKAGYDIAFTFLPHSNDIPLTSSFEIGRFAMDADGDLSAIKSSVSFPAL